MEYTGHVIRSLQTSVISNVEKAKIKMVMMSQGQQAQNKFGHHLLVHQYYFIETSAEMLINDLIRVPLIVS